MALSRHIGSHPASLRPYLGFFKSSRTRLANPSFRARARAFRRTRRSMACAGLSAVRERGAPNRIAARAYRLGRGREAKPANKGGVG